MSCGARFSALRKIPRPAGALYNFTMTKIVADPHLDFVADASGRAADGAQAGAGAAAVRPAAAAGEAPSELVVVICTFPTMESIGETALILVGEKLCACVNILHESLSIYRWNDEIVTNKEVLCLLKTTRARHADLVERLSELHPYEVPEIITLPTSAVNEPYLQWVKAGTTGGSRSATSYDGDESADDDR